MKSVTVAQLREQLANLPDDSVVVVACEHGSYIRFAHFVSDKANRIVDHGHDFVMLYGSYDQVVDRFDEVGRFDDDDTEGEE